jgi:RNA polymerase sigma factor (sigma-70 family)
VAHRGVITRFRDGDPDAVRAVYGEYGRLVYAVAYRILGNRGLAQEATQHAFVKAWRAAASFDTDRELGPWLAAIARRVAIDVSRREAVRAADPLDSLEAEDTLAEPPAELEDRVVAAIAQAAGAASAAAAPPAPAPQAARAPKKPGRESWVAQFMSRPAYFFSAIGALVAVIALVTAVANSGSKNPSSPLRFAMVVTGTAVTPSAHGSATLTETSSGWRIDLRATGLPPLSGGRYYQAWLKNSAGTLVPVGTFNDAVNVTLWSGVPATRFRTLTVTRQQAGGNPASSGQRVLVGTIGSNG